ncbi:hypothetical protein [Pelolinea submarina]|uniref:Uncharacterized protein n=1 Tax=Pelolinea submarina TaxID=913107 RepID=A0A3E0AIQ5_9CHLR|nr:hypothetical protein [Pelolinea submarina]REG11531.1 hypothetical protein DFR64_1421 [Pelolinea submarina]
MRKTANLLFFLLILILTACQVSVDMGNSKPEATSLPAATNTPMPLPTETQKPAAPDGWLTYQNTLYGFEISYPPEFQSLDDQDSLSGWPNAVVLLYNGGQSYDIAIQVWDSQADLDANFPNEARMQTVSANGKIISLFNVTQEPENAAVIATFRLLP